MSGSDDEPTDATSPTNAPSPVATDSTAAQPDQSALCVKFHLRLGWWSLLLFICLGLVLELFHGIKSAWYLDAENETRRLMWTLAHAHGTLLSLVQVAFAFTVTRNAGWSSRSRSLASKSLTTANLLIPAGFFLGGLKFYHGDPGLGILLLPAGALCLIVSVFVTAKAIGRS